MGLGGGRAPRSSTVEFSANNLANKFALAMGLLAITLLQSNKGGKDEFVKLLEIFLVNDQSSLGDEELDRSVHFLLMKSCLARLRVDLVRLRDVLKFEMVSGEGDCCMARYASSLTPMESEQERLNQWWDLKVL